MFRIKICGITNEEDLIAAGKLGADAAGFIFYKKSPREISPAACQSIIKKCDPFLLKVGVFVNETKEEALGIIKKCRLGAVQFHGSETPAYCAAFKKHALVIKAFSLKDEASLEEMKKYAVDAYLVDTYHPLLKGGTGKVFNLKLAKAAVKIRRPLILSGGLNPENVIFYLREVKPDAIDAASGIEEKPGIKNIRKMESLIRKVKNYVT